jgi:hypothetical protein
MSNDVQVAAARAKMMGIELWGTKFPMMGMSQSLDSPPVLTKWFD